MGFPFVVNWQHELGKIFAFILGSLIGSIFPDVDTRYSNIHSLLRPISVWFSKLSRHRGMTHSVFGLIAFSSIVFLFSDGRYEFWFGFTLGYISHLCGDMLTKRGCPLLWPLRIAFRFPIHVSSGSRNEKYLVLTSGFVLLFVIWLCKS